MKIKLLLFACLVLSLLTVSLKVNAQNPAPDVYYTFDEESGTVITDSTENDSHGLWYTYFGEQPGHLDRSGWKPSEGYRNGAAYLAGDHAFSPNNCPDPGKTCTCSSGTDLLIFAPVVKDETPVCFEGILSEKPLFHSGFNAFTVAFWFKNDYDYLCADEPPHYSFDDDSDCAIERQVLFTMGDGLTGLTIEAYPNDTYGALLKATINGGTEGEAKALVAVNDSIVFNKWSHIAVTFEGDADADTGTFALYLEGEFNKSIKTEFGSLPEEKSSVVFGGENGASVTDFNVSDCWNTEGDQSLACGITSEYYGTLRYGWLARGWLDELAFWKGSALNEEEITAFARVGSQAEPTSIKSFNLKTYRIYPTLVNDYFKIENLSAERSNNIIVFNTLGKQVMDISNVRANENIYLPSSLKNGIYYIKIYEKGGYQGVGKITRLH